MMTRHKTGLMRAWEGLQQVAGHGREVRVMADHTKPGSFPASLQHEQRSCTRPAPAFYPWPAGWPRSAKVRLGS